MTETEKALVSDFQPYGRYRPNRVQRMLITLGRHSFMKRGVFRGTLTKLIFGLGSGALDIAFRGARYRIRLQNNLIEYGLLLVPDYNAEDIDFLLDGAGEGANFVDLGSNIGLYALPLAVACRTGRVVAVDANAKMVEELLWNAEATGLANLTVVHAAVSDTEGRADLLIRKDDLAIVSVEESAAGPVPMRKLEAVLAEAGLDAIYGLKIDIEGHEDRALVPFLDEGPTHLMPRRIVIEHPEADTDYPGCAAAFARNGYRLVGRSNNNSFYLRDG